MNRPLPVLAFAYALGFASSGIQLPLTSTAMSHVGFSMSAVGLMWAVQSVQGIFGPALWGVLADRRGDARPFAILALASGALLLAALATTTSAGMAILIFGLYGLLCAPSGSLLDGMTLTALGSNKQDFGRWRAWGTVGFGVTAFGSAMLIDRGVIEPHPTVVFPVCAALNGAGAVALLFLPRLPRPALTRVRDILPVLRQPEMIALFITSTLLWCSHVGYSSFVTPLATAAGLPEWSVGGSLAAAIVVEAVMLRESPRFIARFGGRALILGVCVLTVLRWALTAMTSNPTLFIALNGLHGITFGLFFATLVHLVASGTPPQMRQAAQGAVGSSAFGLGGALGSLLAGNVLDGFGPEATWLTMSGVATVALFVAWRFVR